MEAMNNVEMHKNICEQLNKIYEQKNHDYGDSFHDTFIEEGMAMARIRLSDKLNRFKRLSKLLEEGDEDQQKVADESIEDTLLDLANYAIMTVMEMRREAAGELAETLTKLRPNDSLLSQRFQIPGNSSNSGEFVCHKCGNKLTFIPKINKYICGGCGTMFAIDRTAAVQRVDTDELADALTKLYKTVNAAKDPQSKCRLCRNRETCNEERTDDDGPAMCNT